MSITGMSEQWVVTWIEQKGDSKCIPWKSLWDLILAHSDMKKRVDVFALSDNYKKNVCEISNTWNQTHRMKRFAVNPVKTPKYNWEWGKRVNDNIPMSSQENIRPIEEHLQVILSELEIIKQDFEKEEFRAEKKIEQLEEENM
ncbi:hypothetical protein Goari_022352 [Gossypium aridum]|uniref:Uncharacterized protein n=1 Tax=Gossypium aridum TaxID=34290 RepID=A0A7J8YPG4_GOSAI|nr:hypothetical protein [Gossypium aridum]